MVLVVSKCCKVPVKAVISEIKDFQSDKSTDAVTMSNACSLCGKPCGIEEKKDLFLKISSTPTQAEINEGVELFKQFVAGSDGGSEQHKSYGRTYQPTGRARNHLQHKAA